MMTDLDKLIEAVASGVDAPWSMIPIDLRRHVEIIGFAFGGSLDAAKALYEALLPGWIVQELSQNSRSMGWNMLLVNPGGTYISSHYGDVGFINCPARAWLIATLKAYSAQVQK